MINFMLIGAVKAGSSSVYHYLSQHPDIYMSPMKETKFFQWDGEDRRFSTELDEKVYQDSITTYEDYLDQFSGVDGEKAIGEATPSYLYNRHVAERVHARYPNTKLIVVLRQPVDRAFSHYLHTKRLGHEPLSFENALASEQKRISANWGPSWHYSSQGYYFEQLERFYTQFGHDKIKVYLFDDLKAEPRRIIQDMYAFLGVDPTFIPDTEKIHNPNLLPKNAAIHGLINKPNILKSVLKSIFPAGLRTRLMEYTRSKNSHKPTLDPELRRHLTKAYLEDIHKLEGLLNIDLGKWYK